MLKRQGGSGKRQTHNKNPFTNGGDGTLDYSGDLGGRSWVLELTGFAGWLWFMKEIRKSTMTPRFEACTTGKDNRQPQRSPQDNLWPATIWLYRNIPNQLARL